MDNDTLRKVYIISKNYRINGDAIRCRQDHYITCKEANKDNIMRAVYEHNYGCQNWSEGDSKLPRYFPQYDMSEIIREEEAKEANLQLGKNIIELNKNILTLTQFIVRLTDIMKIYKDGDMDKSTDSL